MAAGKKLRSIKSPVIELGA